MRLKVTTNDGKHGVLATPVLEANAFKPVEVQFPDGATKRYYLRELQIDQHEPKPGDEKKKTPVA